MSNVQTHGKVTLIKDANRLQWACSKCPIKGQSDIAMYRHMRETGHTEFLSR